MRNFLQIASGVDVIPLALELHAHPELWNVDSERLHPNGPHRDSDDIWIRANDKTHALKTGDWSKFNHEHDSIFYPAFYELPSARKLIFDLMARVQGERLGDIFIWRVQPSKQIFPHIDASWHVNYYDKFNICIQGSHGAAFLYPESNEAIPANPGDVHRFINTEIHSCINNSSEDYIMLCVCIRTHRHEDRYKR